MRKKTLKLYAGLDLKITNTLKSKPAYSENDDHLLYDAIYKQYTELHESINQKVITASKNGNTKRIEELYFQDISFFLGCRNDPFKDKIIKRYEMMLSLALRHVSEAGEAIEAKNFAVACTELFFASRAAGGAEVENARLNKCKNGGQKAKADDIAAREAALTWLSLPQNHKKRKAGAVLDYVILSGLPYERVKKWFYNKRL